MSRQLAFSVTLADCTVQTFRAGGKGGQNQNKRETGVRIIHPPSGARGESRDERSQLQNKKLAWRRMSESKAFQAWCRKQVGEDARTIAAVERELWPDRTLVEVKDENGAWTKA
jgi:protein subunit release factor B